MDNILLLLSITAIALPVVSRQMFYSGVEAERRRNGTPAERIVQMERDARSLREISRFLIMMSEASPKRRGFYREASYQNELKRLDLRNQASIARLNHSNGG